MNKAIGYVTSLLVITAVFGQNASSRPASGPKTTTMPAAQQPGNRQLSPEENTELKKRIREAKKTVGHRELRLKLASHKDGLDDTFHAETKKLPKLDGTTKRREYRQDHFDQAMDKRKSADALYGQGIRKLDLIDSAEEGFVSLPIWMEFEQYKTAASAYRQAWASLQQAAKLSMPLWFPGNSLSALTESFERCCDAMFTCLDMAPEQAVQMMADNHAATRAFYRTRPFLLGQGPIEHRMQALWAKAKSRWNLTDDQRSMAAEWDRVRSEASKDTPGSPAQPILPRSKLTRPLTP